MKDPLLIQDRRTESLNMRGEYATAALHPEEEKRLFDLMGYEILDEEPDPILDRVAELAATACKVPIAMVSLVDKERTIFKAAHGIQSTVIPRGASLCAFSILESGDLFVIPDTHKDPRFANNPYVTGKPFVRFYAGAPLLSADQLPIGSLCVVDHVPKEITPFERTMLLKIAKLAMARIESRLYRKNLEHLLCLEKNIYNKFLHSTAEMALEAPSFDSALHHLMDNLDPKLGWLSARVRNMQTGDATRIVDNSSLPQDIDMSSIWQKIDASPGHPSATTPYTEFISMDSVDHSYSHLVIPVRVRDRLVALMEFIYPDHRKTETRIRDIFDLMASNLSIVAERELIHLELQHQATHDSLTGVVNRDLIMKGIEEALKQCDSVRPDSLVLFFDIDGFKEVNDNFGHETGDNLLIEVTRRLESTCRDDDLLGRLSGDEFILLARGIDVENGIAPLLERLQMTLSPSFMIGDLEIKVNASIGCSVISSPNLTVNELLRRAEEAMYLVKTGERKGFCIADEEVVKTFQTRRKLKSRVIDAFHNNRFFAVFQPIVDLRNGIIVGFEALIRLQERDGTVMPACDFMQTIQQTRFLPMLDEYVLAETLRTFRSDTGIGFLNTENFRFSVNIGPAILSGRGYATYCLSQLEKSGLSPKNLMLEIIESRLLQPSETVLKNLETLREQGVTVALDDFGTGYSNLQQLSTLPVDIIKIDKEFIQGIASGNLTSNSLLGTIIGIGKSLGYEIIAEGVESKVQADYLKALGCHYAQGYYFGKPLPMSEWRQAGFLDKGQASPLSISGTTMS